MKKNQSNPIFFTSFLFLSLLTVVTSWPTSYVSVEADDEREFDYVDGSKKGPSHWGELKKEWEACKKGGMQSPIDLSSDRVQMIPKLWDIQRFYRPGTATVKNRGHDISLQWDLGSAGSIKLNGTNYVLQQCHWHSPSEHTINGRRYDLELHMVHVSQDPGVKNKIAVVGLLYRLGQPDPFLSKLMKSIATMVDKEHAERNMGVVDPSEIKMWGGRYLRYMGSLTVPPCTEGVTWTINGKINTVSRSQVNLLREAVHDYADRNARPLQPLNRRDIHIFLPNRGKTPN